MIAAAASQKTRADAAAARAEALSEALQAAQAWHEQLDYDEALNVIDAALATARNHRSTGSEGSKVARVEALEQALREIAERCSSEDFPSEEQADFAVVRARAALAASALLRSPTDWRFTRA